MEGTAARDWNGVARIVALAVAIILVLWIGIRAANPPAVVPTTAPDMAFSAERAMVDVRTIALRPHPTSSADILRVRTYLTDRLHALGLQTEERRYMVDPVGAATLKRWDPKANPASEIVDLIGILPGRDRLLPAVTLMAHMDTVWGSPGGGDDTIGLASTLEVLRAIRARGMPERDIVVLFTDGEEIGLSGAKAFWPTDGLADHIGAVVNLEARGAGGRATMFETGDLNGDMIRLMASSVRHPVANSMSVMAYRLMPNSTDFTVTRDKGLPGFNFAIMGRAEYYHSPRATADRLDPRSLQDMGGQVLDLVSALANAKALPQDAEDAVFFDVAGHGLIVYPAGTGWLVLLIAAAGLGAAWVGAARSKLVRPAGVGTGLLGMLWLAAHGLLLIVVLNLVSGSAHPNYYDRLAALPRLEALALLASLAVLAGWLGWRRLPRRVLGLMPGAVLGLLGLVLGGPFVLILFAALIAMVSGWFAPADGVTSWNGWIAAIGLLLSVAVIVQATAPMAAWIFAWPVMVLAIAAAIVAWSDAAFARPWSWAVAGLAMVVTVAPLVPLAHLAFLGIGGPLPEAMLAFLLLLAAAVWPLGRIERPDRRVLLAAGALLVAALAIAVQVRTDPIAETIPAYSLDK
ncbi:M20/M25/M40 family metallo-hydrolase [Sphingomonas sp. CGMCC 1.13654]|uniref:Vacuolar membrane protease n=1 Tax=Sphingomonas chungangi TaxID=2683589 RepID=A0A838L4S1_9SPHN|nr:M20/M25/M40 family metallo-hydrolase [Sphingomonas chungangi]MBA2933449.1 M20/M25/M40 family metallo-hydrolase [Sphingomonas chungangi]MVW54782.1 M20/M25/M40 family metallo-hydrolase [Sphingomonas chungangi]